MPAGKGVDNVGEKYKMQKQIVASLALIPGKDKRRMRRKTLSTVRHTCEDLHFKAQLLEAWLALTRVKYHDNL